MINTRIAGLWGLVLITVFSCKNKKQNSAFPAKDNKDSMVLLTVKPFEYNGGWGYDIFAGNKKYIHQDQVPAIAGKRIFLTKEDALKTGNLVVQKIIKTGRFTIDSLDMANAGIRYK